MLKQREKKEVFKNIKGGYLKYIGILLFVLGLFFLLITYSPLISAYIDFHLNPVPEEVEIKIAEDEEDITKASDINEDTEIVFLNEDFGLYIPKIKVNAKVIKNVDPYIEDEYIEALRYGIAHASGSSFPNQSGNVFLFAHSAVNFYEQSKYNIYFYLLNELEKDDDIYVSYNDFVYRYSVLETEIVDPEDTEYLGEYMEEDTLTLMSCYPAGTNWKRVIVIAVRDTE